MNPGNAVKHSHEPIEKTCVECGDPYPVARTAAHKSVRCPECQKRHTVELVRIRKNYNASGFDPTRAPKEHCRVCGKTANRYPHYCSTKHYLLDFQFAYGLRTGAAND